MARTLNISLDVCLICGWLYDEAIGSPEECATPGTFLEEFK